MTMTTRQLVGAGLALAVSLSVVRSQTLTPEDEKKARDLLRQAMGQGETPRVAPAPLSPKARAFADMERQYLEGKISARQFQKFLREQQFEPAGSPPPPVAPPMTPPAPASLPPPLPAGAAEDMTLSEVEKRMEALLRAKAEREKAGLTNLVNTAGTNAPAAGPKTKRQRLDELLRLHVEGRISEAEYKQQRAKLIAEPD
jgi:hypothetical protein